MNKVSSQKLLASIDHYSEYVPIFSYITLLINEIQTKVIIPRKNPESISTNFYISHVKSKSTARKLTLLVPVFGNLILFIHDMIVRTMDNKELMLEKVSRFGDDLRRVSHRLKNDIDVVKAAVEESPFALWHVGETLQQNSSIVMIAIDSAKLKISLEDADTFAPESKTSLRMKAEEIARAMHPIHRSNREIMLELVKMNGLMLEYASDDLKSDEELIYTAFEENLEALKFVENSFQIEVALDYMNTNIESFYDLPQTLKENPTIQKFWMSKSKEPTEWVYSTFFEVKPESAIVAPKKLRGTTTAIPEKITAPENPEVVQIVKLSSAKTIEIPEVYEPLEAPVEEALNKLKDDIESYWDIPLKLKRHWAIDDYWKANCTRTTGKFDPDSFKRPAALILTKEELEDWDSTMAEFDHE